MRMFAFLLVLSAALPARAGSRSFNLTHHYSVPRAATLWIALPSDDPWQRITDLSVSGAPWELVHDLRWGNTFARAQAAAGAEITVAYRVQRDERAAELARATGKPAPAGYAVWLEPQARVPLDQRRRQIAARVTRGQ